MSVKRDTPLSSSDKERTAAATLCFRTVSEHPEERALRIHGTIPAWLEGVLYRTGPGQFEVDGDDGQKGFQIQHWFDGKALNHRFHICGALQTVSYRSRFACGEQVTRERRQGRPTRPSFAQPFDPCERLYVKFKTAFRTVTGMQGGPTSASDANVNVVLRQVGYAGGRKNVLLASTDEVSMQTLDPTTLEPIEALSYATWDKRLHGHLAAAHSATIDGLSYNYILKFGPRPFYKLFCTDEKGTCTVLRTIYDAPAAYLHSLAVTTNHVILTVWQADIGMMGLGVPWKNNVLDNIIPWSSKRKTVHYIVNRLTGRLVRKVRSNAAFFCFHHINAFETADGAAIVLDLATFADTKILQTLRMDALRDTAQNQARPRPEYRRIVLPLASNSSPFTSRPPCVRYGLDLPTVHPSYLWRQKARYVYGVHSTADVHSRHLFVDAIIKLDLDHTQWETMNNVDINDNDDGSKDVCRLWKEDDMVPSEPIFVPRPDGTDEDDGVLLTVALNVLTQESQLIILDASTMKVVARAGMDCIFPFGFHGLFCPDENDDQHRAAIAQNEKCEK